MLTFTNMNKFRLSLPFLASVLMIGGLYAQVRFDPGVNESGHALIMPWTGGYNAPQFSNIDFNRDGITDLISFDKQGDVLRSYVHLPATGRWVQSWEYENIFPDLVDWVLIVDFDNDGVEDLFTSSSKIGIPGVTVYKGSYENDIWIFQKLRDRSKDYLQIPAGSGLTNLYVSWDDIPAITDIDQDGDIDILAFEPGGSYISYYQNQSVELGWGMDSLRFDLVDFCWGKILENELSEDVYLSDNPGVCSDGQLTSEDPIRPRHSGSTITAFDQDLDGDQDALVGDITSKRLVFLNNGLNAEEAWITSQEIQYPSNDVSVNLPFFVGAYLVQLDDDPEDEMLAAVNSRSLAEDRQSVWRYDDNIFTDGPLEFQLTEMGWLQNDMIDLGSHSRPAVADINGDDLKDVIIGGYHYTDGSVTRIPSLWYYKNIGTSSQPYFELVNTDYLGMSAFGSNPTFDFAPAFGDLNDDEVLDLVVGDQNGKLFFYQNTSAPGDSIVFEAPVYPYMNINVGVSATPQIADINGDGLPDLVIGERTGNADINGRCSVFNYFQNIGSAISPSFNPDINVAPNTGCFGRVLFDIQIGLPQYSAPALALTDDGWIMVTGNDPGKLNVYGNLKEGITGSFTLIEENYGSLDFGNRSAPVLADLNNDGKFEIIVGNQRGGLEMFNTDIQEEITGIVDPGYSEEKPYEIRQDYINSTIEILWKDDMGRVTLFDLYGRLLLNHDDDLKIIDLHHLVPGIYFLSIQLGDKVWTEKVVISSNW